VMLATASAMGMMPTLVHLLLRNKARACTVMCYQRPRSHESLHDGCIQQNRISWVGSKTVSVCHLIYLCVTCVCGLIFLSLFQ
jgi:hypothetical protein